MIEVFQTAIAGLRAAEVRAATAASNIANMRVEIQELESTPLASPDPLVPVSPPQNQFAAGDNDRGSLAANLVELMLAQHAYEANAVVIRTAEETDQFLLDALA